MNKLIKQSKEQGYREEEIIEIIAFVLDKITDPDELDQQVMQELLASGITDYPVGSIPFQERRQEYLYDRANRLLNSYYKKDVK